MEKEKALEIWDAIFGMNNYWQVDCFGRKVVGDVFFDETYDRHEDYILWLSILKRGIVAKGNHKVLETYIIHPNSKNSNKSKLVKSMYRVCHESQKFNWLKSWILF